MPETLKKRATFAGVSAERNKTMFGTRVLAFKDLLDQYFDEVEIVDCRDYKQEMSGKYDVTVFDQTPTPIKERVMEYDDDGQLVKYEVAHYITEDYDHATIFMSHTADRIGRSVGSKLDWLCLCLDAEAHHMNMEHPIFNTPIKVDLTMKVKPTPEGIYHYDSGKDVPKEIPMWRVQTEGYMDGKGYRIGLVSRGNGFLDSPDAEYISSGVCLKDVGAIALGRHASFFLWGFSGSPDYMTDEAKLVFVNSVVYINKFKGVKPIARKRDDRVVIRDIYVDNLLKSVSDEGYKKNVAYYEELNKDMMERVNAAKKKKESGAELTQADEFAIMMGAAVIPTYEDYLKEKMGEYSNQFGTDVKAFQGFLNDNREYFHDRFILNSYSLDLDKDAQSLGISNRDVKLLEKCVELLVKGEQVELAKRLLARYTEENFESAKEWKKWYITNKKKFFFTESGGYKWLVNTL